MNRDITLEASFEAAPSSVEYLAVTLYSSDGIATVGDLAARRNRLLPSVACGAQTASFPISTPSVTVIATPATSSVFVGWSSPDNTVSCGARTMCNVTLGPRTVNLTATFEEAGP
jgi:hypothetical protein